MPDDREVTVFQTLRTAQEKYTYFLLGAAGAAIAFAVTQTHDAKLSWSQTPLAISIFLWGLSFIFGCLHLQYGNSILHSNIEMLRIQRGAHPEFGARPDLIEAASQRIRNVVEKNSIVSSRYASWQFWSLVVGAVFYLLWHIYEMYLRVVVKAA
jgi:hypothetical protein